MATLPLLLSACNVWEQLGHGPGDTRFNPAETVITPDNVGALTERWSSQGGSEPILSGDKLYYTVSGPAGDASVRSLDADTGAVVWETALPAPADPASGAGPVVLAGGDLWVSYPGQTGCDALLHRLDPATGRIVATETGPPLVDAVVVSGSTLAYTTVCLGVGDNPQHLVVRDITDASRTWRYRFPEGSGLTQPSIGNGTIFVAAGDDVYAFGEAGCGAATCEPKWVTSLGAAGVFAVHRPVVGPEGIVYASVNHSFVHALEGTTGAPLWRTDRPAGGFSTPLAVAHGKLYVSTFGSTVPSTVEVYAAGGCGEPVCASEWAASIDGIPISEQAVGGDVLYAGSFRGGDSRLVAFAARGCGAAACPPLAELGLGDSFPLRIVVAGGRVAVVTGKDGGGSGLRVFTIEP